jgi:hypothetical protein
VLGLVWSVELDLSMRGVWRALNRQLSVPSVTSPCNPPQGTGNRSSSSTQPYFHMFMIAIDPALSGGIAIH